MNAIVKNWKTTAGAVLGVLVFLAGYFHIGVPVVGDWGQIIGMVVAAGSGLLAHDKPKAE